MKLLLNGYMKLARKMLPQRICYFRDKDLSQREKKGSHFLSTTWHADPLTSLIAELDSKVMLGGYRVDTFAGSVRKK
jgi:hypothetical protein